MSKTAKITIIVLVGMIVLSLAFAFVMAAGKQGADRKAADLSSQIDQFYQREKTYIENTKQAQEQLAVVETAKNELAERLKAFESIDVEGIKKQVEALTRERDEWQQRVNNLTQEREGLLAKIAEQPKETIVYKYIEPEVPADQPAEGAKKAPGMADASDDVFWAQVLKDKAALELEVEKLKTQIADGAVSVTELKKKNSDLQLEISKLANEKDEIQRQIKYGKDLSDSLSLELARAQNDKKFLNDRMIKINEENDILREQMKQLTSTKIALEKSIVRIQDEKKSIEKRLLETENVIQGRIDEIWDLKKSINEAMKPEARANKVELTPIVVSSGAAAKDGASAAPGLDGNVLSVNQQNNFVIIDVGEGSGIKLGDTLNVYRGAEYVAGLEVIQIRKDIAAADIISKVADIQVGDAVR